MIYEEADERSNIGVFLERGALYATAEEFANVKEACDRLYPGEFVEVEKPSDAPAGTVNGWARKIALSPMLYDEVNLIEDDVLSAAVDEVIMSLPICELQKPSSSSGKYHPIADTLEWGNLNHIKNVVAITNTLCDCRPGVDRDVVIAAAILHDAVKYAELDSEHTDKEHPEHTAIYVKTIFDWWSSAKKSDRDKLAEVVRCIDTHSGQFDKRWRDDEILKAKKLKRMSKEAWIVHEADMLAAQRWFNRVEDDRCKQ